MAVDLTPLPPDYPRRNLAHAVAVAMEREGHLLTAGERVVVAAYQGLPEAASGLYARLLGRAGARFRLDRLAYPDVPEVAGAAEALVDGGLAGDRRGVLDSDLLNLRTVAELRAMCRVRHVPTTGRRAELLDRLAEVVERSDMPGAVIEIRHRRLFRRLKRWFLMDHDGDLSRMVLADLGHVVYPVYTPTGGIGLFRDRGALLAYEALLDILHTEHTEAEWAAMAPAAVDSVETAPVEPAGRRRFSPRHLSTRLSSRAIRAVERVENAAAAVPLYRRLLDADPEDRAPIAHRLALCLGRLDQPTQGARVCREARDLAPAAATALTLERTGRRLARAAGVDWTPLPPLTSAPIRDLPLSQVQDSPPMFDSPDGVVPVEPAVAAHLRAWGRAAIHGENALWTTLFGLLFRDVLFAPVEGMLPARHLHGPVDLGRPGFADRRAAPIADRLAALRAGAAPRMLTEVVASHGGEAIVGVDWSLSPTDVLNPVCAHLGGPALAAVMHRYATDFRAARSGMPDICILPGVAVPLPGGTALSPGLVFAEIKGPTDALRDNQRCWHHHLLSAGVSVELWRISSGG